MGILYLEYFNSLPGSSIGRYQFSLRPKTYEAKIFDLLGDFGFSQLVLELTQKKGHILDLVMYRQIDNLLKSTTVSQDLVSDHNCVLVDINVIPPTGTVKSIKTRKIKSMDREAFWRDISAITPESCQPVDALDSNPA